MRIEHVTSNRGYAMAALLVAMGVIAVVLSTTLPVFSTMARRERESELVFRGQQYARAVSLFQRKYGNALPPSLDVLLNERFLRKEYKDPITGGDFQLVGPGSPELAEAVNSAPGQQQPGRGGPQVVQQQQQQQQRQQQSGRGMTSSNPLTQGTAPGGILGVVSKSKDISLRVYNNRSKYNEWVFIAVQMSQGPGGQGGTQMPGGRGGAPLGAGRGDGRGRRGAQPPDNRGPFGQPLSSPGGNRPGGPGMGTQGGRPAGRF